MKRSQLLDLFSADAATSLVYGEPHQTADGTTVITAARVTASGPDGSEVTATPVGAMVIHGDQAKWVAAVGVSRIGMAGVLTGLLSAVIVSLAVLRRPPWPDLRVDGTRRSGN